MSKNNVISAQAVSNGGGLNLEDLGIDATLSENARGSLNVNDLRYFQILAQHVDGDMKITIRRRPFDYTFSGGNTLPLVFYCPAKAASIKMNLAAIIKESDSSSTTGNITNPENKIILGFNQDNNVLPYYSVNANGVLLRSNSKTLHNFGASNIYFAAVLGQVAVEIKELSENTAELQIGEFYYGKAIPNIEDMPDPVINFNADIVTINT